MKIPKPAPSISLNEPSVYIIALIAKRWKFFTFSQFGCGYRKIFLFRCFDIKELFFI